MFENSVALKVFTETSDIDISFRVGKTKEKYALKYR